VDAYSTSKLEFMIQVLPAGVNAVPDMNLSVVLPAHAHIISGTTKINGVLGGDITSGMAINGFGSSSSVQITYEAETDASSTLPSATELTIARLSFKEYYPPASDSAAIQLMPGSAPACEAIPPTTTSVRPGRVLGVFDVATGSPMEAAYPIEASLAGILAMIGAAVSYKFRYLRLRLRRFAATHDIKGIREDAVLLGGIAAKHSYAYLRFVFAKSLFFTIHVAKRMAYFVWYGALVISGDQDYSEEALRHEQKYLTRFRKLTKTSA
jgi:hypothetical protein